MSSYYGYAWYFRSDGIEDRARFTFDVPFIHKDTKAHIKSVMDAAVDHAKKYKLTSYKIHTIEVPGFGDLPFNSNYIVIGL